MINVQIPLPEGLARDAEAAGLLNTRALRTLIREGIRRKAAQKLLAGAAKASAANSQEMSLDEIQCEVADVRKVRRNMKSHRPA
ncbi:MAG: hypothetical protein ABL925_12025 [Methylococcales bacterium]